MDDVLELEVLAPLMAELDEPDAQTMIAIERLDSYYGSKQVLKQVSLDIPEKRITAFIGPSGCGKSTALRCMNRMNDLVRGFGMRGKISLGGQDISGANVKVNTLRRTVGMVFQHPNPFPMSIHDNIALALKEHENRMTKVELDARVREALEHASLWDEVGDSLDSSALSLSGGQQQRLCIARALAVRPAVLMLDEPCASLDPISTAAIERLLLRLRDDYTIIIVTHNLAQARRISDFCGFFLMGELVEWGTTRQIFEAPKREETARYLSGAYG